MTTPFTSAIDLIQDGKPVDAATTNKPITELAQRTQALKEVQDSLEAGSLLRVSGVVLESGMAIGTSVYLDTDSVFKPAQVVLADTAAGGAAAKESYVFGVILSKDTDTSGIVAMVGRIPSVDISSSDWANVMVGGVYAAGHYFLSDEDPGKITTDPGALAIYVGQALTDGSFLLRAAPPVYGAHTHYHFTILGKPAGTANTPGVGDPQSITVPDDTQRGWLPVASFNPDNVPVGAVFGYNIAHEDEAALAAVFPPIPVASSFFEQGGAFLDTDLITVNDFGIWWMDDSYGNAPWPTDYVDTSIAEDIEAWFTRLLAATSGGIVQRLENHPSSVLEIQLVDANGVAAVDGKLKMLVQTILANAGDTDAGVLALKNVTGGTFVRGPVASRIKPGAGITVTSSYGDTAAGFYGAVTIAASSSDALQGNADSVNLHNARLDEINDVQMVTLPVGRTATPVFTLNLSRLASATNTMRFKLWLYSTATGTIPAGFEVEYKVIPVSATNTALPTSWTTLTSISGTAIVASQALEITMAPSVTGVTAGSVVLLRVTRDAATSDGFGGNLGLIRVGFQLT